VASDIAIQKSSYNAEELSVCLKHLKPDYSFFPETLPLLLLRHPRLIEFPRCPHTILPLIMPGADRKPKTLYDKVFDHHIVNEQEDGTVLIYIGMLVL
jgi:hypothetical protein